MCRISEPAKYIGKDAKMDAKKDYNTMNSEICANTVTARVEGLVSCFDSSFLSSSAP
jgi:hypothetical protein